MNCSDYSTAWVCRTCGSLISLGFEEVLGEREASGVYCRICDRDGGNDGRGVKRRKGVMDVIPVPCEFLAP